MRNPCKTSQRGQATTEFFAAMLLFIPLIMAVMYSGKYADIKHQAIQASRYAAMARALDPRKHQSDQLIQNETVARFFRDGAAHQIGLNDVAQGPTAGDENPNWGQLNGDPMLAKYQDVVIGLAAKKIDSVSLLPLDVAAKGFQNMNTGAATEADVTVKVAAIPNWPGLDTIKLQIHATAVIAGDPMNADGAADVANHFTVISVPGKAVDILNKIPGINQVFELLAGAPAPQFGCVKADVVPDPIAPGAKYQASDPCN